MTDMSLASRQIAPTVCICIFVRLICFSFLSLFAFVFLLAFVYAFYLHSYQNLFCVWIFIGHLIDNDGHVTDLWTRVAQVLWNDLYFNTLVHTRDIIPNTSHILLHQFIFMHVNCTPYRVFITKIIIVECEW